MDYNIFLNKDILINTFNRNYFGRFDGNCFGRCIEIVKNNNGDTYLKIKIPNSQIIVKIDVKKIEAIREITKK